MLTLLSTLALWSAPLPFPKPDPARDDLKALQGAWVLHSSTRRGVREEVTQESAWIIEGDRLTTALDGKRQAVLYLTLDARAKPRSFGLANERGGGSTPGRYRVEGDSLTVRMSNEPLPFSDVTATGDVWVFRRKGR